ncbi:hypothetical protein SAY87_004633 [Trapa incisa]|uniref:Transmembrane protein n=1 Tax=Trapa incisa TaxID=236973 RepID=A0AAN7JPC4_9MYRT|nr:hypothetical protein SAY87_004633 [Trapa incisa]
MGMKRLALLKKLRKGAAMRWKKMATSIRVSIFDTVLFKVVSVVEAIALVSTLCFFYLCCGCHI